MTTVLLLPVVALLANGPVRPLFHWGARPAAIVAERSAELRQEAVVTEVHLAPGAADLLVRFTFDRAVREVILAADGHPISGRLRATLYWDADDDTRTGLDLGRGDPRTGPERRLDVGVVSPGEDAEEKRAARALVTALLHEVAREGRERILWRTDDDARPPALSWRDSWVELRVPQAVLAGRPSGRAILAQSGKAHVGRVAP